MPALTTIALGVATVTAVGSISASKKAADANEEASRISRNTQQIQDTESRRQQLRDERIRRAQIVQASENTGTSGSSGASGALSGVSAATSSNLAFQSGQAMGADAITRANQESARYQQQSSGLASLSQLGFSAAGSDLISDKDIFGNSIK